MPLPKHKNPTHDAALAPYNFVPLPEAVVSIDAGTLPDHDGFYPNRRSGHIDCLLTTESPLYVRCPLTPAEFAAGEDEQAQKKKPWREQVRNRPDFYYSEPGRPRIPGSSLRGMLRSIVEIASYSKLGAVSDRRLVYRAVGDTSNHGEEYRKRIMHFDGEGKNREGKRCLLYTPLVRAGYMEKTAEGDWAIRPALEVSGVSFARIRRDLIPRGLTPISNLRNAHHIYVRPGAYEHRDVRGGFLRIRQSRVIVASARSEPGLQEATLAYSGEMFSKRTEAVVFAPDKNASRIPVSHEMEMSYREQVSQEQVELLGSDGVLREGQPVFYLMEEGKLVFFGHTMMMRLPYQHEPADFAPKLVASEREPGIDFAQSVFGYTKAEGKAKARAYASRVFVSDAVLEPDQQDVWLQAEGRVITPHILGGPKPTTFQHYLTQQQPDAVEIGRTRDGAPRMQKQLSDYAVAPGKTVLRGHKLYWHKGKVTAQDISAALEELKDKRTGEEKLDDTQHTQMKPVKAGVRFTFRIHFENLSAAELGSLVWAILLPGAPGKEHRHSLGMGKPLGMGAARLEPLVTLEQPGEHYAALFGPPAAEPDAAAEPAAERAAEQTAEPIAEQAQWHTPTRTLTATDQEVQTYVEAFDAFVRQKIGVKASSLGDLERIQMLLKLMEWPGPERKLTRYLEIERPDSSAKRGKVNEYRDRPVLPDPLHVAALFGAPAPAPEAARPAPVTPQDVQPKSVFSSDDLAKPQRPVADKPAAPPAAPATAADLQPGMTVPATIVRLEPARIALDILGENASLTWDSIIPPVPASERNEDYFPIGETLPVVIKGRNKQGRLQAKLLRGL